MKKEQNYCNGGWSESFSRKETRGPGPASSTKTNERSRRTYRERFLGIDMYSYNPEYQYPSYSSYSGAVLTLLSLLVMTLYIFVTARDFYFQPPELVKQASFPLPESPNKGVFNVPKVSLSISYYSIDEVGIWTKHQVNSTNNDPHFRFEFKAMTIKEQDRYDREEVRIEAEECTVGSGTAICPKAEKLKKHFIQGTYDKKVYQYFEVELKKCTPNGKEKYTGCASMEDIDKILDNGNVMLIINIEHQLFDTTLYHSGVDEGIYNHKQTWRYYAVPEREQLTEMYMEARNINIENRFLGSPPIPERKRQILTFHSADTTYKKMCCGDDTMMNFYVRMHPLISEEEVVFWIRSVLDLWGSWGAFASFITVFSFGALARWYNGYKFQSHFNEKTAHMIKTNDRDGTPTEYVCTSDIRLFNNIDFDDAGRFNMTKEEFNFPSSAFGEMRKLALERHIKKRNAAQRIAGWYFCQLIKRKKCIISLRRQQSILRIKQQKVRRNSLTLGPSLPILRKYIVASASTPYQSHSSVALSSMLRSFSSLFTKSKSRRKDGTYSHLPDGGITSNEGLFPIKGFLPLTVSFSDSENETDGSA